MVTSIEKRYIEEHKKCQENYSLSKSLFPNGVTHDSRNLEPFPYYVDKASGAYKWDIDGQRIIDYRGGHGALILGHSHPVVNQAVSEQLDIGTHYAASTDLEIRWANLVKELIPCFDKIRFTSSGTEATLMAFRMVRAYSGKTKIIKFKNHFHGWHDYVRSHTQGTGGIPQEVMDTMITLPHNDISVVEDTLRNSDDVAAIIIEPTGAHMGTDPVNPHFLKQLRDITNRYGVVLIFDEVVTGFRISKGGAQSYFDITPDVCTLAKILGGGLPAGAVTGKSEIIDMIQLSNSSDYNRVERVGHNGTFNANPLSAAAGCAALELVSSSPVNEIADKRSQQLKNGLNDILSKLEIPGCASGIASAVFLRLGVEHECDKAICILSEDEQNKIEDPFLSHQMWLEMYNQGIDAGTRFIVNSVLSESDINQTIEASEKALRNIRQEGII